MTREEAIIAIHNAYQYDYAENIIKTLNQTAEQEPCEDAVSRQAVFNQIFYSTDNSGDVELGSVLRRRIENLPPVTPKPLDTVLDEIRAEIPKLTCGDNEYRQALVKVADVIKCIDKYRKGESE